jgi:uncharacterized protein
MKKTIFILALAFAAHFNAQAQQAISSTATFVESEQLFEGEAEFPLSDGWVTDLETVFTDAQEAELESIMNAYEESSSNEIALVTVIDLGPYKDVSEYAASLGNQWELGKAEQKNGVLLLVSLERNLIHIAAGEGTKQVLTDKACQEIISYTIVPEFKQERYFEGIKLGLEAIIERLNSNTPND